MGDIKQASSLLRLANADFKAMTGMSDTEIFEDAVFGFDVRQAIQKSLKALLCSRDLACPRTHDLGQLFMLLSEGGIELASHAPLSRSTPFAVEARYVEGTMPPDLPLNRASIVAEVGALLEQVGKLVGAQP